jgi:shikimate dehydrogenase
VVPARLAESLQALRAASAAGNITIPHKQAALAICDVVTPLAARVGAVNTFWTDPEGRLCGDNTDVGGFEAAVRALVPRSPDGLQVLLLGAGGAALAVREAVAQWPDATLHVWARRPEQAGEFVRPLGERARVVASSDAALARIAASVDLVVNATPLGLRADDAMPLAPTLLGAGQAALDLTYRRDGTTDWVAACRARGVAAEDGIRMLVEQGALAFERWFGLTAPRAVMMAALGR